MASTSDTDRGWAWVVLVAVYAGVAITAVLSLGFGVLYVYLLDHYQDGKAKTSVIGSLNGGLLCLLGPVASLVMNASSCRICLICGGLLTSLSFFISYFVESIDGLIVSCGLLGGVGGALASTTYTVVLGYYFEKRRSMMISLSVAAVGIGLMASSPLVLLLVETYGLRGCFLILSGIGAHLCIVGAVCKPSSIELALKRERKRRSYDVTSNKRQFRLPSLTLLTNLPLLLFFLSTMSWNLALAVCINHLPNYMAVKGSSSVAIGAIMTVFSVSNTAGRLIAAMTVGKTGVCSMTLHIGMLGIAGIATITFPFYAKLPGGDYVFASIIGLYTGGPNSLMTPVTLDMVGVAELSVAHGWAYFFCGVGYVAGPPIAGYLFGATGSYEYSFVFSGCTVLVGSFLAMGSAVAMTSNSVETALSDCKPSETSFTIQPPETEKMIDLSGASTNSCQLNNTNC